MSESSWTALRRMFVDEYDELRRRLAVRLGSADAAGDALQDTFLQLAREGGRVETIHNPKGYLFRMAMNVANSRRRTERRRLSIVETQAIEAALETPDDRPGPAEVAEARSDLQLLRKVLDEMPQRRREMFLAALVDGASHRDLAERYGLSMRMIQIEMKKAGDLIAERFGRAKIIHFAPEPRETSKS
ncbi:RNA polymerase sigma factor [Caulobacter sp. CCUG 60055]|uniref:RNA polymerase sigma factor n=1 Tax=Caulobacter sp. CCUG 60055 TaxID=2100090 RepID=UPI001FA788A2